MKARPNLNGNTPVDFVKAGEELLEAAHELTTTLNGVRHLIHGRNYQTYEWSDVAQYLDDDKCKFVDHMIAVEALRDYAYAVLSAAANTNEEN